MKLTPDTLPAHLDRTLLRAYLVSGDEPLLTGEAAAAVRASARARGFTDREVHFIERAADWDEARAAAASLSLFGSQRVLEIRMNSSRPGAAGGAALLSLIESNAPDIVLLILTPRLDRDAQAAAWVRAIEAEGGSVAVWPIGPDRLVSWLRTRARRLNLDVTSEALELLAERTEGNLLAANQELEKLVLLASGATVNGDLVLKSVADSARFDVFQLSEAALAGDTERSLRVLSGLRTEAAEPTLVLWALTKAIRDLWGAYKDPHGAGSRGWARQEAALERGMQRAPRLRFPLLTARATRIDRMVKGRLEGEPWDEMMLLITEFCGRALPLDPGSA